MKITGGRLRGRVVRVPERDGVRPTASRVREAVFHVLRERLLGATVLDAFGGSGLLSLEAWSRGAASVVCIERDAKAAAIIRENAHSLGVTLDLRIGDVRKQKLPAFDIVLADPPYADDPMEWARRLTPFVSPNGVLVLEHRTGNWSGRSLGPLQVTWDRRYGDSSVVFLSHAAGLRARTVGQPAEVVSEDDSVVEDDGHPVD